MICQSKSDIRKGKLGTPGSLVIPGYVGEMGDVIEAEGDDPDFPGLRRKWRGVVTAKTDMDATITGRFWIGNRSALKTLEIRDSKLGSNGPVPRWT